MRGFDVFMRNQSWKRIYDNAPTEFLREYYRFKFDTHPDFCVMSNEEENEKLAEFRAKFSKEEWQYLIDTTENLTAKIHYKKMMEGI